MEAIKINNKKFFKHLKHLINALGTFNSEADDIDDLDEIYNTKIITVKNTAFLYVVVSQYEQHFDDQEIIKEFRHIKKILNKYFEYDLNIKNRTTYLQVSNKNEG